MQPIPFTVDKDHPALPGHFPGNPITPGVVILDHVFSQLATIIGIFTIKSVRKIKFLGQIKPGETININFDLSRKPIIKFLVSNSTEKKLTGIVEIV